MYFLEFISVIFIMFFWLYLNDVRDRIREVILIWSSNGKYMEFEWIRKKKMFALPEVQNSQLTLLQKLKHISRAVDMQLISSINSI
jgi:hypothetical protein